MKEFAKTIQAKFDKMISEGNGKLFRSSLTGNQIWDLYMASFPNDPIFRDPESSVHNCNSDKSFLRRYGNIVSINDDFEITTFFDVLLEKDDEYFDFVRSITPKLQQAEVSEVFVETLDDLKKSKFDECKKTQSHFQLGIPKNVKRYTKEEAEKFGVVKPNETRTFYHFNLVIPKCYVSTGNKSVESLMAAPRDNKNVFMRAMDEIPLATLELVRDLIAQGSLLDGDTHLHKVQAMIPLKRAYDELSGAKKDNFCWLSSSDFQFAKFKNELIGVLCSELAEGVELNKACRAWNKRVDPANYMKAVAPFTEKQKKAAEKFVIENGYQDSFNRRLATLTDISVDEILHVNNGSGEVKDVSIFDNLKPTKSHQHKKNQFEGIGEVSIEKFHNEILPNCTGIEAYLENRHVNNMVTMTNASGTDGKPMFKWNNNYSWDYNGNLAGKSQLREEVKSRGGSVTGVFRFSHSWNEIEPNKSLMDLHVFMPNCQIPKQKTGGPSVKGRRVGWNNRVDQLSGGSQDVDYTSQAPANYIPVENITFPNLDKMPEGKYECKIHNWNYRNSGGRGKAEIEFEGEIFQYEYPKTTNHEWVDVATVTLKDGKFSIEHHLPETNSSKEIYGLESKQFHKVNLVCLSPNHWTSNGSIPTAVSYTHLTLPTKA